MTSITRTLTLSLGMAAAAIFLFTLGIVIWLDQAREREHTFCQAAAAILIRATAVDPGRALTVRSTRSIDELKSNSPNLWYVVSYARYSHRPEARGARPIQWPIGPF